jgi:hypothetical protein
MGKLTFSFDKRAGFLAFSGVETFGEDLVLVAFFLGTDLFVAVRWVFGGVDFFSAGMAGTSNLNFPSLS